jgi:GNAT superfamily N-acetyltransferase
MDHGVGVMARPATADDIDSVTSIITRAFAADPIWSVALAGDDGDTAYHKPYWRLYVEGAAQHGTVFIADDGVAASVWLPPGTSELDEAATERLEALIQRHLDDAAIDALHELFDRFEASRSSRPPHYYLSLLATHPDHAGKGLGQQLLAANLARWDAAGVPSYLESTNPANDHRYQRLGFRIDGGFRAVRDDAWVSAMWREVGGATR